MYIKKIISRDVVSVHKYDAVDEVAKIMKKNNVGTVIVVDDENNSPIGILTDRDIVMKIVCEEVDPKDVCASDIMSSDLLVLKNHQRVNECVEIMGDRGVRRAPVVDEDDRLCGVASLDDFIILFADEINCLAKLVCKQAIH